MGMLIAGLAIWILVHLFPSLLPGARQAMIGRIGNNPYQGLFALCVLSGLLLIIFGWRSTAPGFVYLPPPELRHAAMALMLISIILVVGANFPATRIKLYLRHPQLTGVVLWAIAHLLANGELRSLVLFGAIGAWGLLSMLTINRRDGVWIKLEKPQSWGQEFVLLVAGLVVYALIAYFHQYLSGIPLMLGTAADSFNLASGEVAGGIVHLPG